MDIDRQIRFYQQKFESNPNSLFVIPLADMRRAGGDAVAARDLLIKHKSTVESNISAMIVLGKCFHETGNRDAAIELLQQVLSKDSNNRVVAKLLQEYKSTSVTEMDSKASIEITETPEVIEEVQTPEVKSTFVTMTIADIYLQQGHREKALEILNMILEESPRREDVLEKIAKIEGM
ncbi:MAG: tetratricopeptide repeat protein [bacterium]|nr:tetratricopeptide repeat protein [bacterium]MCP4800276.1 tetratricopeptide repeat protein [bacterium]